jgi:hypothetical protein
MHRQILIFTAVAVIFSIGFIVGAAWTGLFTKKPPSARATGTQDREVASK